MKGYVPQKLNTDRRFTVQTTSIATARTEANIKPDNQESIDIKT